MKHPERWLAYVDGLVQLNYFDGRWLRHLWSDGRLNSEYCRAAARKFVAAVYAIAEFDPDALGPLTTSFGVGEPADTSQILQRLDHWAQGNDPWPYPSVQESEFKVISVVDTLRGFLEASLGVTDPPPIVFSGAETFYRADAARWGGHLPDDLLGEPVGVLLREASISESIVVVGDIRRSQDLMTYARDAASFGNQMIRFIEATRNNIWAVGGFFDKFTGDGFLAYFNQWICQRFGVDHIDAFLSFVQAEGAMANALFAEWTSTIRKLPAEPVGLAIGADAGQITFTDMRSHLIAVGDAIVWANRMASAGRAGEVIITTHFTVNSATVLKWCSLTGPPWPRTARNF